jgi:hypothetical protein
MQQHAGARPGRCCLAAVASPAGLLQRQLLLGHQHRRRRWPCLLQPSSLVALAAATPPLRQGQTPETFPAERLTGTVVLLLLRMMGRDWVQAPGWPRLIGRGSAGPRATKIKPHHDLMIVPEVLPC